MWRVSSVAGWLGRADQDAAVLDGHTLGGEELESLWVQVVFYLKHPRGERARRVILKHGDRFLQHDGASVVFGVHEVHRYTGHSAAMFEHSLMDALPVKALAAERRK